MGQLQLIAGGVVLLSVIAFLVWFWGKAKQAGYTKGVSDEQKNTDKKLAELARKLYGDDSNHFGLPDVQAWDTPADAGDKPSRVVKSRDKADIR